MVRALQRLAPAAAVRDRMPAVPADVDERAQFARAVAEHDDRRRAGVAREELPLLGDLTDVARVLPRAAEDPLLLLPVDAGSEYHDAGSVSPARSCCSSDGGTSIAMTGPPSGTSATLSQRSAPRVPFWLVLR